MNVYMGQILQFTGNFVPQGFLPCDGRLLSIADNATLFQLLGTAFGGDGSSTFALPNLVGCVPVSMGTSSIGTSYVLGQTGGAANVTLNVNQSPAHSHALNVVTGGGGSGASTPGSGTFVSDQTSASNGKAYASGTPTTTMGSSTSPIGGSQPHSNMQPVLAITFGICIEGVYPSQS